MFRPRAIFVVALTSLLTGTLTATADDQPNLADRVKQAVERSLPLLEITSAGTADRRTCFTCHGQAMPAIALIEAQNHGFHIDSKNLRRQLDHTYRHLKRSQKQYESGRGTGGQVDTAGWALWALEAGDQQTDAITDAVIQYLLVKQNDKGLWTCSSNRPPSEASDFTTTYLAIRGLDAFAEQSRGTSVESARGKAATWFRHATPKDTEDRVFQLLSLPYLGESDRSDELIEKLKTEQKKDGGWSQLPDMDSDAYATATVLYGLAQAGVEVTSPAYQRGIHYLLDQQLDDGSWLVVSRSRPFQKYFESGAPHGKDQFISTSAASWAVMALLPVLPEKQPDPIETLEDSNAIEWPESDLSARLMSGAHRFIDSRIDAANQRRRKLEMNATDRMKLREQLRHILGVVDKRVPPRLEVYGNVESHGVVAESKAVQIYQVRWPVFGNVFGEGLWVRQRKDSRGLCIVVPDADQSPEQLLGLAAGLKQDEQIGRRLAAHGLDVLIPTVISRGTLETQDERTRRSNMAEREWIYRQAFHMGRHVIGYDLQRIFAAVDWFGKQDPAPRIIAIAGYGEGGLIALHASALDTRISGTLVSGYFDNSDASWSEPIYRNVWRRSLGAGNAEVASLIMPRRLIVEHSTVPAIEGHKGSIETPEFDQVYDEFERIRHAKDDAPPQLFAGDDDQPVARWSKNTINAFLEVFDIEDGAGRRAEPDFEDQRGDAAELIAERQRRAVRQAEQHVQSLVRQSEHARDDFFLYKVKPEWRNRRWSTNKTHPIEQSDSFIQDTIAFRDQFATEGMGRFDVPLSAPNPRTRKVAEADSWTAYDVVLDVHDSLFAWGVLVVPKGIKAGERRPVVVCQHGRNGVPRDTIDNARTAYNDFAARLAERGFVTFAPHNLYRGEDRYRWLDRKANAVGCSLFSFIIASHDQILKWLSKQPFVDEDRIAFYGLSYGGETAVRVPTILEKYCLSICSGDFNQWTRKVAATDQPFSFMRTIEWEMPYWNLGNTFDYAEMTYLMFPRPFMVERGHHDGVGRDHWVAHEFAKVRWLYAQFGLSDRVAIEFFQGGHSIHGEGTFEFLHKHLRWPKPSKERAPSQIR